MIGETMLKLSCGCRIVVLGEHLHMMGCSSPHEAQLDRTWSRWCAERDIAYGIATTTLN